MPGGPSGRVVVRRAIFEALGLPSLVLLASMTGFGSLARESSLGLDHALLSTAGVWGLPGQLAFAELYAAGSEAVAVVMAVSLANARFLPMAVSFMPLLQVGMVRRIWLLALVQLMSVNTWAAGLRVSPTLSGRERRLYFAVFGGVCMSAALVGTAVGFFAAGSLPRPVTFGLVFLNPVFFALIFADMRGHATAIALAMGAVLGPLLHLVSPDWGVLATGLIAGTGAFLLARVLPARRRRS